MSKALQITLGLCGIVIAAAVAFKAYVWDVPQFEANREQQLEQREQDRITAEQEKQQKAKTKAEDERLVKCQKQFPPNGTREAFDAYLKCFVNH